MRNTLSTSHVTCDILLLLQQFLHALIAINPCEGGWLVRQIRENKHCGKKTILQLASGDNVAPHAVPSASKKETHEVKVHKSDYNTSNHTNKTS